MRQAFEPDLLQKSRYGGTPAVDNHTKAGFFEIDTDCDKQPI